MANHVFFLKLKLLHLLYDQTVNAKNIVYINEPGLYQSIFSSKKAEAKQFTKWIVEDVIPSLRKTGKYILYEQPILLDKQISLSNERDLHFKVIDYVRKYYPHALLYAGLGELQDTSQKRIYAKCAGYIAGQSDIIINNLHKTYNGLTIEKPKSQDRERNLETTDATLHSCSSNL